MPLALKRTAKVKSRYAAGEMLLAVRAEIWGNDKDSTFVASL